MPEYKFRPVEFGIGCIFALILVAGGIYSYYSLSAPQSPTSPTITPTAAATSTEPLFPSCPHGNCKG